MAPYRINQPGPDALKHSASPWQPGFSISTHTTSNPNAEFPPSNRRGGTYQRFSVICATAWAAKGLGELPLMWGWRNISIPFFFFFSSPNSFYFLYLFFTVSLAWSAPFLREARVMCLSLFSNLHMKASRLKPCCQAEARRTRWEVTEEEKGSLPPSRRILPWDLPGTHGWSASIREVDQRLHPHSVWQMVTVFLGLLACMFGFLPPHFKTPLSPLAFPATHF